MAEKKAKKAATPPAPVKSGPNTARRNSKAWKRRVCGDRHSPTNCPKCVKIYSARHDAEVERRRALRARKVEEVLAAAPAIGA